MVTFQEIHKEIEDDITVDTNKKVYFRDTGLYIQSSADGKLLIASDGTTNDALSLQVGSGGGITLTNADTLIFANDFSVLQKAGAPSNGTSGDGAGVASKGSLLSDITNGKLYINTGTKASPDWTVVGTQT